MLPATSGRSEPRCLCWDDARVAGDYPGTDIEATKARRTRNEWVKVAAGPFHSVFVSSWPSISESGGYVSLARLKLFQIEEQPGDDGGVQSWGTGMTFVTRLRNCTPNPFAKGTSVNYELGSYGPVTLTVHDVSGRLVRRLESGPRQAGIHTVRWDGADSRGHIVPAGVYFVRFAAGDKASTGRLTLVR